MATVEQYTDTMSWTAEGTPATFDPELGFPKAGNAGTTMQAACRYENFGRTNRKEYTGEDGKSIFQMGAIYVKFGQPIPNKFERVVVTRFDKGEQKTVTVFEGPVLNVYRGQLNSTLAV